MKSTKSLQPQPCRVSAKEISVFAEKIAEVLKFQPGSDLEPIVKRLNGKIEYLQFTERDSKKASITVKKGGKFTIRLTPILFPLQKRMSIAHELGHLFLHSRYGEVALEAYHDTEEEDELIEEEAHEFACEFLMPTKLLRQIAKRFYNDSINVAAYFMVPEPVARQRMVNLGCC